MKTISAGIIAYFFDKDSKQFKFLMAHPGGPYFKNVKNYGFPKGQQNHLSYAEIFYITSASGFAR